MKPKSIGFVVLVALFTAIGIAYSVRSQLTPKPFGAFMVTSVMSSPQAGSPHLRIWTISHAVRADGSWVRMNNYKIGDQEFHERDIHDYQTGVFTIVEDATRSTVTESIPSSEYKHRNAPAVSCEGSPAGQILGLNVNYFESRYDITGNPQGDANALEKKWIVPSLGCFVLQKETLWTRKSDGVLLVDTKITPVSVDFRPVDEFFQIPSDYTARSSQELRDQLNQRLGVSP
jgi:hypothetical protein